VAELGQATTDAEGVAQVDCVMPSKVAKKDCIVCEAQVGEAPPSIRKPFKARRKSRSVQLP
jgi:hypothetical protein